MDALPPVPSGAVVRPRLESLLDAADERLAIVVAPPGYGKTVLLSQWARRLGGDQVRWLRLTSDHNDVRRLRADLGDLLAVTLDDLRTREMASVIILDDFHALVHQDVLDECAALIEDAPPSLRIVLSTRVDPPLRFYRDGSSALVEIRHEDLAFTVDEASRLLERESGRTLSAEQVTALVEHTEGWAVGLHFAAAELRDESDVDTFVEGFNGTNERVEGYFDAEVLGDKPTAVRRFLAATSAVDRMSGPLCDYIADTVRSHATLEELDRTSTFIMPLDEDHSWFRYHRMFREALEHRLRGDDPTFESVVLHRAGTWHMERGEHEQGIDHLLRAGAWTEVVDACVELVGSAGARRSPLCIARSLERVPLDVREQRADAILVHTGTLMFGGEPEQAMQILDAFDASTATPAESCQVAAFRATLAARCGVPAIAISASEVVLRSVGSVDESELVDLLGMRNRADLGGAAFVARGIGLLQEGRLAEAAAQLEAVPWDADDVWHASALAARSLLEAWRGLLASAEQLAHRALVLVGRWGLDDAEHMARLTDAVVARGRGDVRRAGTILEDLTGRTLGCVASLVTIEQARVALAFGDPAVGLAMLGSHRSRHHAAMPRLVQTQRSAVEAELHLALGDLASASRVVDLAADQDAHEIVAARVRLAVERDDIDAATELLEAWAVDPDADRDGLLVRELWRAVLDNLRGDEAGAVERLDALVATAKLDGNVGLFQRAGPHALGPARPLYRLRPSPFLGSIVDQHIPLPRARPAKELVEQVTRREHLVLALLPTRLSNAEIAARLDVSPNTVKTHLKHIYRKLGVSGRREAVLAAERLHVL